jgi:hypothetical protein
MKRRDFIKSTIIGGSVMGAGILASVGEASASSSPESKKKKTEKRALVCYASRTNNTAKVAERFKSTLLKYGWQCDLYKIGPYDDPMKVPFDIKSYDLVCAGSGVHLHVPYEELLAVVRAPFYHRDPRTLRYNDVRLLLGIKDNEKWKQIVPPAPQPQPPSETGAQAPPARVGGHGKIVMPYNPIKAVAFVTYAGYEFGVEEVLPCLDLMALELKHLQIETIGKFACPGKMGNMTNPIGWHDDLVNRPNERDLLRAELFMEEIVEAMKDRSVEPA